MNIVSRSFNWVSILFISSVLVSCASANSNSENIVNSENQNATESTDEYPPIGIGNFGKLSTTKHTTSIGAELAIRFAITDFVEVENPMEEMISICSLRDLPPTGSLFRAVYFDATLTSSRRSPVPYVELGYQIRYKNGTSRFSTSIVRELDILPTGLNGECVPKTFEKLMGQQFDLLDQGIDVYFSGQNKYLEVIEPGDGIANFTFVRIPPVATISAEIESISHALLVTEIKDEQVSATSGGITVGKNPMSLVISIQDVFTRGDTPKKVNPSSLAGVVPSEVKLCALLLEVSSPSEVLADKSRDWIGEVESLLESVSDYDVISLANEHLLQVQNNPSQTFWNYSTESGRSFWCGG